MDPRPVLDDLARLVAFPTISDAPIDALAAHLADRWDRLGLQVRVVPSARPGKVDLLGTAGPPGTDGLVLSGHMDVVPVADQPWTSDPFILTTREARAVGRGSADMKGFLACVHAALSEVDLSRLRRRLVLIWTCDEEVGCLGAASLRQQWDTLDEPLPSACVVGEPTGLAPMRMHPGHVTLDIEVRGEAAHSSRPDLGRNAIVLAAAVVAELDGIAAELREQTDPTVPLPAPFVPLNVGTIHGGQAINVVPDRCVVQVGYRPLPGQRDTAVFDLIRRRLAARFGDVHVHAHLGVVVPALRSPADHPLAAWLAPHARPGPEAAPFATDAGHLAAMGTTPVLFGPGSIDVAHKADEYVPIHDLMSAVRTLRALIEHRCVA